MFLDCGTDDFKAGDNALPAGFALHPKIGKHIATI
jgi:hypothetical protein